MNPGFMPILASQPVVMPTLTEAITSIHVRIVSATACALRPVRLLAAGGWRVSQLLERIARGEQAAFKECVAAYGDFIWSLARRFSRADAEDATQDVFMQLWRKAALFDATRGSEAVFIATLTRRTLINRYRTRQRGPQSVSMEELADNWEPSVAANDETHSEARIAAQALATLSDDQQRVIKLAVLKGWSQSDIASHTGMPLGTVKSLMRRGLIAVREKLGLANGGGA